MEGPEEQSGGACKSSVGSHLELVHTYSSGFTGNLLMLGIIHTFSNSIPTAF